jgi:hypothetical protein
MPGNMISFWRSYMEESIDISSAPRMCARILLTQEIRTKKFSELVEISAPWWMIPARTMLWFTSNTVSWDTADSQADCKERVYIRQVVGKMHRVRDLFQFSNAFTSDSMQCSSSRLQREWSPRKQILGTYLFIPPCTQQRSSILSIGALKEQYP